LKIKLKYFDIADFQPITPTKPISVEEPPYVMTVRLLGLECVVPDRGDLRNAHVTVEIVHPEVDEATGKTKQVHRHLLTGLQKGMEIVHKVRAATGIGFGSRQDGIPMTRKTGKSTSWASQLHLEGVFKQPISPMVVRAMERLHTEGLGHEEIAHIFQVPPDNVEKAVAMRGNFEVVWHEALHFLQPGLDPLYGKLVVSVSAPKNKVRGASDGFIGDFEIDIGSALAEATDHCRCTFRKELHRAKKKTSKAEESKPRNSKTKIKEADRSSKNSETQIKEAESPNSRGGESPSQKGKDGPVSSEHEEVPHRQLSSDHRTHEQYSFEGSGILLEFVVELRGVQPASCELDDGQTLRSREDIVASTTAAGVKITRG